jgi:hypothetical protein
MANNNIIITDFVIANAAITLPYYSYQANPQGYPNWFAYTPTWTNVTIGDATVVGRFNMVSKIVNFRLSVVWGAGTSASGTQTFTLPVTSIAYASSATWIIGHGTILDAATLEYFCDVSYASTTLAELKTINASTTMASFTANAVNATVPMTWTTSDAFAVSGSYEAA